MVNTGAGRLIPPTPVFCIYCSIFRRSLICVILILKGCARSCFFKECVRNYVSLDDIFVILLIRNIIS